MYDLIFGRDRLGDPEQAARLEWLVTNGIGGYASGTASGALTRRYHGLLVAALDPPANRTLLLAKLAERIGIDHEWIDLDTNRWRSGAIAPTGYCHLESFRLEGSLPVWVWAIGHHRLEKRVWMEHGENTTYIQYRLASGSISAGRPASVALALKALVNHRDAHALTPRGDWNVGIEPATGGLKIVAVEGDSPLWLFAPGAEIAPAHDWYRGFSLARETERGLEDTEDHLFAGEIRVRLAPGDRFTVVASTRHDAGAGGVGPLALGTALARRQAHDRSLIEMWQGAQPGIARGAPPWVRQLVLAADAFLVDRTTPGLPGGKSVIAGYPWFTDWGRDAMVALPGIALATGRPEIARAVLSTWARLVDQGMLPNRFPDHGQAPEYGSADAALWFFQAVRSTFEATRDEDFLDEMYPALEEIGAWTERGTRFGVGVDLKDGLVRLGAPERGLTWMDARLDGLPVTAREGKPVEINALWYNALTAMTGFARQLKRPAELYELSARRVERSFERFWNAETGCLYDLIDGPAGADPAVRPNQLLALSLPDTPLPPARRRAVLEACGRRLLTSHGLRSLSPADPRYHGAYGGDGRARDSAYHQGTAWAWLLPHYALAHYRVHADRAAAVALLEPFASLIGAYGVGTLPEIADADPPHAPRGCIAQAWSVGEALRVYHMLAARPAVARRGKPLVRRAKTAGVAAD